MLRWIERHIEPFPDGTTERPPSNLTAFYWYFIKPIWAYWLALLATGFVAALIEVSFFAYLGQIVDLMRESETPSRFFDDHGGLLLWIAFIALDRAAGRVRHRRTDRQSDDRGPGEYAHSLAEPSLRAAPEPGLLPERFCRSDREQAHADGSVAARVRCPAVRCHLVRGRLHSKCDCAVRRGGLASRLAGGFLGRLIHRCDCLLRAADQTACGRYGRGAFDADRADCRQLYQHPDGKALCARRP